jgi:hypothetical protein
VAAWLSVEISGEWIMDMLLIEQRPRGAMDCIAEGLWKFASGVSSDDAWETLPEHDKAWWRGFASEAATRFVAEIAGQHY